MRAALAAIAIIALVLIGAIATGFIDIDQTQKARLPEVKGGQLPAYEADVGDIDVRTKNTTVEVPVIDIDSARDDRAEDSGNRAAKDDSSR
jgi:hypothetical protein